MKEGLVALMLACIVASGLAELTHKRAMTLLSRYGFSDGEPNTDIDSKRAVEDFQDFYSLKQTGELDKETMALLHMPRCGLPDVQADGNGRRTKRFVTTEYKWDKLHLTWRIVEYTSDLSQEDQEDIVMAALQLWSEVSALTFERAADPTSADIVIAFLSGDHGDAYAFDANDLAHAFLPFNLSNPIAGDIHLNDAITWDVSLLSAVIAHEVGHSLGLSHSQVTNSLMYAFYTDDIPAISFDDDVAGIRALYGVKCGAPQDGVNTLPVGTIEGVPGEEYNYTCFLGFTANSSDLLVVCEQNSTSITASWSLAPPTCTAVKCGAPQEGVNTVSVGISEGVPGDEYNYTCSTGFRANTSDLLVVCEYNTTTMTSSWSPAPPTCTEVKCGAPPDGVNTVPVGTIEGVPGEEYNYTCSSGFTANSSDLLVVCEYNTTTMTSSWSPAPPTCTAVKCGAPLEGVNTVSVGISEGVPGDEYNYTCSPDFRANTSDLLVVCEYNTTTMTSSWSPAPPTCTAYQIVCRKTTGTIDCGEQLIKIVSAVWGNTDNTTCGDVATTSCELDVISDMSLLCDERTSCEFRPRRSLFSGKNPCPKGVSKYLNIAHTCEDGPTTTQMATTTQPTTTPMATTTQPTTTPMATTTQPTTTQMTTTPPPMTVTACQGQYQYMNCAPENVVICSAFYGRSSSTICASTNANDASMCFVDVTELVQDRVCNNKPSCYALALGMFYNNHCGSNPQAYLQVTYTCGAGQCGSTQPALPDLPASK